MLREREEVPRHTCELFISKGKESCSDHASICIWSGDPGVLEVLKPSELPANLGVLWLYMIPEVFGVRYIKGTVKRSLKCMNFA